MKRIVLVVLLAVALCVNAYAADIVLDPVLLLQTEFEDMSKELGFAVSYMPLAPAAPLGIMGFNAGIEATLLDIDQDSLYWQHATSGTPPDYLPVPKLHIQKGLPMNIDVGVIYSQVPGTNISLFGGEAKWALLEGTPVTPAFALRASYTTLSGVDTLDLETIGIDASISKGFAILTPYAGVGQLWITAKEKAGIGLADAKEELTKVFGGIAFKPFPLARIALEADYAEILAYSLRFSIEF